MPDQDKKSSAPTESDKQMEDEDFFDEISSQLDNLKASSEAPGEPGDPDDVVELELGKPDSESAEEAPVKSASTPKPDSKIKPPTPKKKPPTAKSKQPTPKEKQPKAKPVPTRAKQKQKATVSAGSASKPAGPKARPSGKKRAPVKSDARGLSSEKGTAAKAKGTKKAPDSPKKPAPESPKKPAPKSPKKPAPESPKKPAPATSETTSPSPPASPKSEDAVDYDDFLAYVSADIDRVKDRFEAADAEESDIVEYDMDDWFLPEEEEYYETLEPVEPTPPPMKKRTPQKPSPRKPAEPEKQPKTAEKTSPPEAAKNKPQQPPKSQAPPKVEKKEAPASQKAPTPKPRPPGGEATPKAQKTSKSRVKAPGRVKQITPMEEIEELYEDVIAQHLVEEKPRRAARRISTKFILVAGLTLVCILAAGFLVMQDPFGLFKPDATTASHRAPESPAAPSIAHKVPSTSTPTPAPTPAPANVTEQPPETPRQKPITIAITEPPPKVPTEISNPPQPVLEPSPPAPQGEPTAATPPPPSAKTDPASQTPKQQRPAPPSQPDSQKTPARPLLVKKEASTAPSNESLPTPTPAQKPRAISLDEQVNGFLKQWSAAWEKTAGPGGEFTEYDACYSDDFMARGMNKAAWVRDKRAKNSRKKWITIGIRDVSVTEQGSSNRVKASFTQEYNSSNYSSTSPKTLVLAKEPEGWKIIGVSP